VANTTAPRASDDPHCKRALEAFGCFGNVLCNLSLNNSVLRRVPDLELTSRNLRGCDNFKIGEWHEVPDFKLAFTHNGQSRCLYSADADHSSRALSQDDGCGAGERQVVNMVSLTSISIARCMDLPATKGPIT
jgi:hypothetical protein